MNLSSRVNYFLWMIWETRSRRCEQSLLKSVDFRISYAKPSSMSLNRTESASEAEYLLSLPSVTLSVFCSSCSSVPILLYFLASPIASPICAVLSVAKAALIITLMSTSMKETLLSSKRSFSDLAVSVETCFFRHSSMM